MVNRRVAALIVRSGSKPAQEKLADAHASVPREIFGGCLIAALRTKAPAEVYKQFSSYYTANLGKGKGSADVKHKYGVVRDALCCFVDGTGYDFDSFGRFDDELSSNALLKGVTLDTHWLDTAVKQSDLDLVCALAHPKHKASMRMLSEALKSAPAKKGGRDDWQHVKVLQTMIRIGHPEAVEAFLKFLKLWGAESRSHAYYSWTLPQMVEDLPKSAVPQLEAILPELKDGLVDSILPHLEALKAK